jgi:hypothetical protein
MSGEAKVKSRSVFRWFTWFAFEHKIFLSVAFALGWYFYGAGPQGFDFLGKKPALVFLVLLVAGPSVFAVISAFLRVTFDKIGVRPLLLAEIPLYVILAGSTYYLYLALWIDITTRNNVRHAFTVFFRWMAAFLKDRLPDAVDTVPLVTPSGVYLHFGLALEWIVAIHLGMTIVEAVAGTLRPRRQYAVAAAG